MNSNGFEMLQHNALVGEGGAGGGGLREVFAKKSIQFIFIATTGTAAVVADAMAPNRSRRCGG